MKKLLILFVMAGLLFTSCNKNKWIETDYSDEIVGTWTALEHDHAAAYVFNADGTVSSFGVDKEEYWEDVKGTYKVENNKITMKFDGHNIEGSFDIIPGQTFSFVDTKTGARHTFQYCKEDLSEEIVGMWVCNDALSNIENDMLIQTFKEDGSVVYTGPSDISGGFAVNGVSEYKVVGDLLFNKIKEGDGMVRHLTMRLSYMPKGVAYGDVMNFTVFIPTDNGMIETTSTFLRIKQTLELPGNKYDYSATYISNVSGSDQEIDIMGYTFSFAEMDGVMMDKMLKNLLFAVEFPDANTIKYSCYYNGAIKSIDVPITVEGNKMTVKMSEKKAVYRDLEVYTFQDMDNCQMHMYMPRTAFVNFFSNMHVAILAEMGELDITDAAAVEAIYNIFNDAVDTINLSFVFKH